jgi:EpsI family protein
VKPERRPYILLAASLLMALALWAGWLSANLRPQSLQKPLGSLTLALGKWRALGDDQKLDQRTMRVLKPTAYLLRNYMDPRGDLAALFIAFFGLQKEGRIIHSPRHCLPGAGWRITRRSQVTIPGPGGGWKVNHLILSHDLDKLSVLYWYQGRGRVEYNEYWDRLAMLLDGVLLRRTDGALVRITSRQRPDKGYVLKQQIKLAADLIPALNRILPPTGRAPVF